MAQEIKKPLYTLYEALKADNYDVPDTYESFERTLTAPGKEGTDNRVALYGSLRANNYDVPDTYESFARTLFKPVRREQTTVQSVNAGGETPAGSDPVKHDASPAGEESPAQWTPTDGERRAMVRKVWQLREGAEAMFAGSQEWARNMANYHKGGRSRGFRTVEGLPQHNEETGKLEKTYLTPDGGRTADKVVADMSSFGYRQATAVADMSVGAQMRRAEAELRKLQEQRTERMRRIAEETKSANDGGLFGAYGQAVALGQVPEQDKEIRALDVAIRQRTEQLKDLQEERDRQAGKDVGFWRGFGRAAGDIRSWDFGISDLRDAATMLDAEEYLGKDASEGEKQAGQGMLKALYDKGQTERSFGENASFLNRAGVMTGYMPSFMLDFALTGGGFEAVNFAGKAAARGTAKLIGKEALKEMTEIGVKEYAKKYGVRGVGRMAENWAIKALGTTADELLVRAPLMTNTVQAGSTVADIVERKLGDVEVDDNGNYRFTNDKTWGSAVWQGEANAIIENYSEMFGTHLDGVAPVLAATFGGKRISGMLARANASDFGKILATTRRQFQRLGVSDYFGEVAEEYYGQLWRTMLGLDDAYTSVPVEDGEGNQVLDAEGNPMYERKNLLFTGKFHGDIWGGMALSMGLMGAGKYAMTGMTYAGMKHGVNKADRVASQVFSPQRWEPIREVIDNTDNEHMGELAESMVGDRRLTEAECAAVLNYMERSMNLRGLNLGSLAQGRGGVVNPDESELSDSYIDGYEAVSAMERNDAQNMYEYQRQRLVAELGSIGEENVENILAEVDENPVEALMKTYDEGLRNVMRDYANAKVLRDGVIRRVNDDIDEQIAQSDAAVDARVNRDTGKIQPVVMGLDNRYAEVVGGKLAVRPDGTIDRENSDESLIVRDAVTGELAFTDPKSIVAAMAEADPEEEKAQAAEQIRQGLVRSAVDAMNGTLAFNPGDVVTMGPDGPQVTIVGAATDGETGTVLEDRIVVQLADGTHSVYTKAELQNWADQANRRRVEDFEQERTSGGSKASVDTEPTQRRFALNDEFTILNDSGAPIRGSITGELDEDGTVEIYTEEPINGNRVNRFTPDELEGVLESYNGAKIEPAQASAEVPEGEGVAMPTGVNPFGTIAVAQRDGSTRTFTVGKDAEGQNVVIDDRGFMWAHDGNGNSLQPYSPGVNVPIWTDEQLSKLGAVQPSNEQQAVVPENTESVPNLPENAVSAGETIPKADSGVENVEQGALSRIPLDEEGEPMLTHESVEPETGWEGAVEYFGSEEDAEAYVGAQVKSAEAAIAAAEKAVGKIKPTGGMKRYREELVRARGAVEAAKAIHVRWQAIAGVPEGRRKEAEAAVAAQRAFEESITRGKAELKEAYEEVKDVPEAVEILQDQTPQTIDEVAAAVLSESKLLWSDEGAKRGVKRMMGWGEGERRGLFGLFATSKNGGLSLERLAEDRMKEVCADYGISYDNQDALTALTDVLNASRTRADLLKYIQNRRIEQAKEVKRDYDRHMEAEAERVSQEEYHMSLMDFESYNDYAHDELKKKELTEAEMAEINAIFADEISERNKHEETIGNEQGGDPGVSAGGPAVLSGEETDNGSGIRETAQGAGRTSGGGRADRAYGTAQEGAGVVGGRGDLQSSEKRSEGETPEIDENGNRFVKADDGTTVFGEITEDTGLQSAPIKLSEGTADKNGEGYGLQHIEARHGKQIRDAGFVSVEDFVRYVAKNYDKDNIKVGKKRVNGSGTFIIQIEDEHSNLLYIELSRDGSYWNVNSGGVFRKGYTEKKKNVEPASEVPTSDTASSDKSFVQTGSENGSKPADTHSDNQRVSERKVTNSSREKQASGKESLSQPFDNKAEQTIQSAVDAASAQVNTAPTRAQAEAGNYKKGHVTIGEFDITIENPAGSVRKGVDADGKEWSNTMANTYGYIKGTEGVDGDHIDVFLHSDMDEWNGRKVFVVDQTNTDGSFDEHKVMLGFNDKDEAMSAYLANYDKTWADTHPGLRISETNIEDFNKWVQASHRKTKPFADYTTVNKVVDDAPAQPAATDNTIDTYTTKKNKTYHRVVFPRADKAVWQERLNLAKKMGGTSVPKGYGFKTQDEAEAFAKAVADPAAVADAQPLSLDDMRSSIEEAPTATTTEAEQATETETQQPEADEPVNPSGNKLVTDERYLELRERMRKKLGGQLNMGVDPEILAIGTEMAVYHIEKGARKFKAYASAMIADLGDAIRPYLKSFYNAVRDMPEAEAAGLVADMDSYDEVRSVDIANFDKLSTDALATAAAVVAEQEAEKEREEAEAKLKEKRKKRTNPDGSTTETVVESGTEIEITSGEFIPGVRPTVDEQKPGGKKKPGKTKPKPTTDGGLFDTVDDTTTAPAIAVPEQRPAAELMGDSAAYQERETQTVELVEEIGGVIESSVAMLELDAESVKPLTMTDVKKMASKYPALKDISDTDLQELVELAMTQLTRSEALVNIDGTAEAQRRAFDHIVNLYQIQPSLNARDSERLIKQQYSTPTPFGFVMGQFVRAGGKAVDSMLEPSAGNGALTITVHPSVIHVNDIDDARLANLRKLGYGQVTAQDALLPFSGEKVDVVMTNPPFGTVTEKVYDGVFRISSLEGQMAINALEQMEDDGRAAIVIGGNTSYRTNGSMNPKDAAFFGYLYSRYNVADVINISGKALYSRNGTGYDVRMILIDGRKTGEFQRVFPPVQAKARAEQVTTFDELYKRVQDDIQQIQQVGSRSADVQRDPEAATDGTASAPVRTGSNRPNGRPGSSGDVLRGASKPHSGQPTPGNDGSRPVGVDNADGGNGTGVDDVPRGNRPKSGQREQHIGLDNGRGRSGDDGRVTTASRPDRSAERLAVSPSLTDEKVAYPNQSENGFTLMSVVPAAQAQVLQKSLGEIGDVDQFLVEELGYSSKEELYGYLAAEQIDSIALAIHQMNKGNAFIIGDMTGVGKGRQGAALIRYAVKQGRVPVYFTQKPTLFTDNYRDLADIGSSDLRPFIIASEDKEHTAYIKDAKGNVVHKLPTQKERERVYSYIMEHGTLPEEYDYVITTYSQIQNGNLDYNSTEDGWVTESKKYGKGKSETATDRAGQIRRNVLAELAEGNIVILDESHTVGGDSGSGRYMQMLTSQAEGVTFMSATFAKRADNMPIYAQRTAIAEAGVKPSELIEAISKGGVTLQEIMSKQLVESGQMIRRERSFEGVTIDWLSVEEETDRRQRQQFNEVADIFNAIRNFQDDYITPLIDAKNEAAAEFGATVGHTQGTKDLGVKNVPFASKMYNLVNQLLFALKVDAVADRVVENLRNGYKPVISFTNTMEGFLSSAPKGVAMDDVPNFSLTLMRALEGVMRFTEKDADENSEGGHISLSELSTEGQNAYNAIRDKIMNLSADLPISPMDAIRMKIEEAGYSVAEITGRKMQLNRTDDGRYIVEDRKDKDADQSMRDFNSGKLDVLMINKSGSTGISLHASSKFEDQRPRVMVFAQFQSDINDEVQMRGRIDRSGQVTRGRYEYIMSTIPAEQRIQMMFKAKLKSLDANTTSSQKSKFNEMEIVDYLNKYGDDVVWEYMKEHPELEERLGDPLDMLQEKNAEGGPRTSEKEDTSKKTGCAGKISRYLAFLSVEEQDEIFREITEAYRVKIQLLDDAGENDLEITTMPLRAETKQKKIWHEGENPGSGNAFADNTYVEEVEVDVLKKPMKRDEIAEATRKLMGEHYTEKNGSVDWQHYVRAKGDEISRFFQAKADEAVGKLKEAGEARIAKAREKAVAAATKARGRGENNFTDEQIQSLADAVVNEEREKELQKQRKRQEEIMAIKHSIQSLFQRLRAGSIYVVPQDLKQSTAEMFTQTFGTFVGFKFNKGYTLGSSTAIFATLDGRRKVELALSDQAINTIISATDIANRYSPDEIRAISLENWDSKVPTQTRQKRYIITGNLLQALVDTEKGEKTRGNLISYSTIDGETRQGILMGENFKLTDLRNSASLSSRLAQIREGKAVVSENGDVQIEKVSFGWQHRGQYELRVPKSKQRGGIYTMHSNLLKLVEGHNFITKGNNMVAYVDDTDIAKVVDMLSRAPFNLTVLQESQLTDVSAEEAEDDVLCRPVADKATLDRLNSEPTIKVYRAMQMIDGGLRPPMSGKVDGEWREATEVGIWEEAEEHPEMADEKGRFKLDKGNGKSIKAAYNPYIHTSRTPINDQFSSAWSRPELVIVEVEVPLSELTSGYRAEKAKDTVGEKEWKSGPVGRALAKIGQARRVILSRWSRIVRVVPVEEVAEAYAQRLNAHGIEVPFNTVPPALRDALAERGVKIGKPEKGNAGSASLPAFQQWINEQERQRMGDGYGAYSDAEVSLANDPISKVMGKNRFSKKRQAEFAARERQRMADRIKELAERMNLDNVEILTDASQLEGKRAKAKGFYNKRTRKITIVIPNNYSTIDAEQTLLHEAVAHYGLRQLFGKQFDAFLDNVYEAADETIRRKIAEMAAQNGWDFRIATEEYLAGLAEDTNFNDVRNYSGWWSQIKRLFLDMLEKIGFEGFRDKAGVVITDNELRYILWRSYENLAEPGRYRSILGEAADVAKQSELKVGNYTEEGIEAEYAAEPLSETNDTNSAFNEQLERQISGTLPKGHIYQLGRPGKILLSTGVPDLPIQMSATRLKSKASEYGHDFDLSEIKDLVKALQKPMAIFVYGDKTKMQNIILGIESNGKQFIVGLSLNPVVNGKALEINSIRNVFPKDNAEWLNWVSQGKLLYVNKREIQALIDKQRTILADVDYLDLDDVTKVVNNFENPTIEEEELFRPGDFTPRDKVYARYAYESIVKSGAYQFHEAMQDSMLGLKEVYKAVLGPKTRIEEVAGFENAYIFENRMSSMNAGEQHEYFRRYMQPLLKEIAIICGANKRKRRELTDYLMAKHGLERNEYMRAEAIKNKENPDRDFAGLIGLTGEDDWRSAEATAQQWVDDYEASVDTTALWEAINRATKASLEKVYLSGVISKDTYEKILGMYQYYIPLRGWDEKTSDQVYGYLTSKDGPLGGSIMKKAEGRKSKADDPIATIGMMADDAIRQGNRNLMKQRFLNFVLNHPSDLVSVHDLWLEFDYTRDEWRPVFADIEETDTPEEVEQKIEAFEERMEKLRETDPTNYKRGREAQNVPYKVVRNNLREHQVLVKRNGRTFVLTINGNPRAAQALNGLTNPDVDLSGSIGNLLKAASWLNRQLSAFYTTRNPEFVVSNFFRDMLYANNMTWVKESPAYALRFHKNFGRVNPAMMRRLLGKWEKGTLDTGKPLESMFSQFMLNGGETGYTNVRDIESHKKAVASEIRKMSKRDAGRKAWYWLGKQLDLLNRSAENCARFAAFVTSREMGRDIDRSIYDAKEISVNFNKKGSGGKMVNATGQTFLGKVGGHISGLGRAFYVFWNAGIQGMANFGKMGLRHPVKFFGGAIGGLYTLGMVVPMLAQMTGGGDGDDDDRNAYYNLPEYVRRSNICFRVGDNWVTIPLPIEFRAIYGLGELTYGVISGNEHYSDAELSYHIAAQVSQLLPIDVLEGGGGFSPFIPSAGKPVTEAYWMNKSWSGLPIYRETPFNKNDPEWTKAYASTDKHLVDFARWLNETTGGDDFKKGAIDINPAKIEYVLNGTFGGMSTFPNKIKKSLETAFGDREFEWRNMPIASRLIQSGDERTANRKLRNEYYRYSEEHEATWRLFRKYEKAGKNGSAAYAEKAESLRYTPEYLRYEIFDFFDDDIKAHREALNAETDKEKRATLESEMYGQMRQAVNALNDPKSFLDELYKEGKLNDEYLKYLESHHGIKFAEAKGK